MLEWLKNFQPPEWPHWKTSDKIAYVISMLCALVVMSFGARAIFTLLSEGRF